MSHVSKVLPIEEHSRKSFQIKEDFNAIVFTDSKISTCWRLQKGIWLLKNNIYNRNMGSSEERAFGPRPRLEGLFLQSFQFEVSETGKGGGGSTKRSPVFQEKKLDKKANFLLSPKRERVSVGEVRD